MKTVLAGVAVAGLIVLSAWVFLGRFVECREHGFSVFYCATN